MDAGYKAREGEEKLKERKKTGSIFNNSLFIFPFY